MKNYFVVLMVAAILIAAGCSKKEQKPTMTVEQKAVWEAVKGDSLYAYLITEAIKSVDEVYPTDFVKTLVTDPDTLGRLTYGSQAALPHIECYLYLLAGADNKEKAVEYFNDLNDVAVQYLHTWVSQLKYMEKSHLYFVFENGVRFPDPRSSSEIREGIAGIERAIAHAHAIMSAKIYKTPYNKYGLASALAISRAKKIAPWDPFVYQSSLSLLTPEEMEAIGRDLKVRLFVLTKSPGLAKELSANLGELKADYKVLNAGGRGV